MEVEKIVQQQFQNDDLYLRDCFENVISKISELELVPAIGCELHREALVSKLIYEYVVIRFRFQAKEMTNTATSKSKAKAHAHKKIGKLQ